MVLLLVVVVKFRVPAFGGRRSGTEQNVHALSDDANLLRQYAEAYCCPLNVMDNLVRALLQLPDSGLQCRKARRVFDWFVHHILAAVIITVTIATTYSTHATRPHNGIGGGACSTHSPRGDWLVVRCTH
jgi:hypothetical protein